ncbi:hypothetical protein AB0L53_08010 [Nonomuraea sp. NPDC052129]|uniref:hypothetical protein n=1 Tax=Nonomuraea sp. NPDC052129 TaxID=3154651 RepID=UPI0034154D9B
MLHQTLPGVPAAVDDARAWIRTVVQSEHPKVEVAVAVHIIGELVASAVRHTPKGGLVEILVTPAARGGMVIEVKDPGAPALDPDVGGWADISRGVLNFGASSTEGGHRAWCELPQVTRP